MISATFANLDVTDAISHMKCPFEVSIKTLSDPQPGVYKFLKITGDPESVLVGEGDVITNMDQCIAIPPVCQRLSPLDKFVKNKRGLWLQCYKPWEQQKDIFEQARKMDVLKHGLETQDTKTDNDLEDDVDIQRDKYDFVVCSDIVTYIRNPIALFCALHNTIREGGYCIVAVPCASQPTASETLTTKRTNNYLRIFDAKVENIPLTPQDIKPNVEFDVSLLRSFLRFSGLNPLYAQQHSGTQVIVARKLTLTPSPMATIQKNFFASGVLPKDVKICPHCGEMFCKDENCTFVYCGLGGDDVFRVGFGCGRSFCFACGKKYCGMHYDPKTGAKLTTYSSQHTNTCCLAEPGFQQDDYCPGGHSTHCATRW